MTIQTVLVTGPTRSAQAYVEAAEKAGWRAKRWDLLTIEGTGLRLDQHVDGLPDCIAVTSSNALPALEDAQTRIPELVTALFACVGTRTAERARSLGFQLAFEPARDAADLAETLLQRLDPASAVLWPRGSLAVELGLLLANAGHRVTDPIVYEARPTNTPPPDGAFEADAVLLTSPSAVAAYVARRPEQPGRSGYLGRGHEDGRESVQPPAARTVIAIGATTTRAIQAHPGLFDAILTLEKAAPEAFAKLLKTLGAEGSGLDASRNTPPSEDAAG